MNKYIIFNYYKIKNNSIKYIRKKSLNLYNYINSSYDL